MSLLNTEVSCHPVFWKLEVKRGELIKPILHHKTNKEALTVLFNFVRKALKN